MSTTSGRSGACRAFGLAAALWLAMPATAFAQQVAPPPATAHDPARIAAAREMMEAQGGIEQANKGMRQMLDAIVEQVRRGNPRDAEALARFFQGYGPDNPKVKSFFATVVETSVAFYAERCSLEELVAMTAFLRTPAGKRFVALAPEVGASLAPHLLAFQQAVMQDVQAAIQRGDLGKK